MTDTYVITGSGTSAKATIVKDPDAVLDYTFDWTEWLDALADTLADHQVIAEAGLTLETSSIVGKKVVAWLSGGTEGTTYRVTCRVTTASSPPRIDDRSIFVKIKER